MINNKVESTKKQRFNKVVLIGSSIVIELLIGIFSGMIFATYNIEVDFFTLIVGVLVFFVSYLVHILIHEMGHFIFGLLTGYSFVSFRVGSLTFIKEDGKLKRKKMNLPGTGGQCLMSPPNYNNGDFPFVLYNLGGVLINLIFSVGAFLIVLSTETLSLLTAVLWISFALAGLFTCLTNGIPMRMGGMPNDGYNIYSILKDEENKQAFFNQLKINALMTQGERLKDMPLKTFQITGEQQFFSPLKVSMYLLEYNWYIDNLKFDEARKCLEAFEPRLEDLPPLFKNELNCERLFMELSHQPNQAIVEELYNQELQNYIKVTTYLPNKKRLMMAYEAFYRKDNQKAIEYYDKLKQTAATYPVKGEAEIELMLGRWIKEKMLS